VPVALERAITTSGSAITPLVVQPDPSSTYCDPSSDGVAMVLSRAGSSRRRAGEQESANFAARAPRQVALLLVVGPEQRQRLRHADRRCADAAPRWRWGGSAMISAQL
jgi:hypothetical protein